jgi:hypothetical protein
MELSFELPGRFSVTSLSPSTMFPLAFKVKIVSLTSLLQDISLSPSLYLLLLSLKQHPSSFIHHPQTLYLFPSYNNHPSFTILFYLPRRVGLSTLALAAIASTLPGPNISNHATATMESPYPTGQPCNKDSDYPVRFPQIC